MTDALGLGGDQSGDIAANRRPGAVNFFGAHRQGCQRLG